MPSQARSQVCDQKREGAAGAALPAKKQERGGERKIAAGAGIGNLAFPWQIPYQEYLSAVSQDLRVLQPADVVRSILA